MAVARKISFAMSARESGGSPPGRGKGLLERGRFVMDAAPGDVAAAYVARLTEVRDPAPS